MAKYMEAAPFEADDDTYLQTAADFWQQQDQFADYSNPKFDLGARSNRYLYDSLLGIKKDLAASEEKLQKQSEVIDLIRADDASAQEKLQHIEDKLNNLNLEFLAKFDQLHN